MASLKYTVDVDTRGARSSLAQLEKSIGGIGAAVAGGFAVGEIVQFGDSIVGLQNKLRSLTGDEALVGSMFKDITNIAGAARAPLQETGDLYFRIARAAQDLGISQQQTSDITESLAKSMSMTGATAQETSGALLQLGQALQSGRFQGDELRSVLENMPIVSKAMADELGVTIGELRDLGSQGKITSDVFVRAMAKNKKAIDDAFARSVPTAQQALNNLKTSLAIAFDELAKEPGGGKIFVEAAQAILNMTKDVNALASSIKSLIGIVTDFAVIWLGLVKGPQLLKGAMSGLATLMTGLSTSARGFGVGMVKDLTSIKNSTVGLGTAFGIFDKSRGSVLRMAGDVKGLSGIIARFGQFMLSSGNILKAVFSIGLRFAGWVGIFLAVVDVINALYKAVTGSKKNLIDLSGVFKFLIDVVKVAWYLIKELASFLGSVFGPILSGIGSMIGWVAKQFMQFSVVQTVIGWISNLWGYLGDFWAWLKGKAGIKDEAAKPAPAAPPKNGKNDVFGDQTTKVSPKGGGGKGSGKSPAEIAKEQAEALKEVKKAILEVTAAYKEQASARLEDLNFQLKSLTMSEDQVQLEQNRRDILKEQSDALADLSKKEQEIKDNKELSNKGRQEALALIAQERAAIQSATQEELAASEATLKAIQAKNIEIAKATHLMELQQKANENKAALTALEDQIKLVGLYGDKLEDTTAQLELQNKLREIDVEYQNALLDLENQRTKLGEERYAMELANIAAVKAQAVEAANAQAAAQKKLTDLQRKSDRYDVKAAIGKRMEELARSVDPAITAVESLNSVFDRMGDAIDNFVDTGKFKFGDFARSVIADIAKIALKAAATKILTSVFGGIFGKAAGGPVMAGKPYIVGEQGPELFVPNSAGSIMTNASMNKNAGNGGQSAQPVVNNTYITNNISAIDSKSVAQMFVENRKSLLGASTMARKELPYG